MKITDLTKDINTIIANLYVMRDDIKQNGLDGDKTDYKLLRKQIEYLRWSVSGMQFTVGQEMKTQI